MYRTIRAYIDKNSQIRPLESVKLPAGKQALITILDTDEPPREYDTALLSEDALGRDWNRLEEDQAWSSL